jgi:hypothetical protein
MESAPKKSTILAFVWMILEEENIVLFIQPENYKFHKRSFDDRPSHVAEY